eukprot:212002-Pleurochrysis_carterae.AAC.1
MADKLYVKQPQSALSAPLARAIELVVLHSRHLASPKTRGYLKGRNSRKRQEVRGKKEVARCRQREDEFKATIDREKNGSKSHRERDSGRDEVSGESEVKEVRGHGA